MSELRPKPNNLQSFTVTIPKKKAESLVVQVQLKIGLVSCSMDKKVVVSRCYRCWEHDHRARDCKGPDRKNLCFNCGCGEHKASVCVKRKQSVSSSMTSVEQNTS